MYKVMHKAKTNPCSKPCTKPNTNTHRLTHTTERTAQTHTPEFRILILLSVWLPLPIVLHSASLPPTARWASNSCLRNGIRFAAHSVPCQTIKIPNRGHNSVPGVAWATHNCENRIFKQKFRIPILIWIGNTEFSRDRNSVFGIRWLIWIGLSHKTLMKEVRK